jgi:serine O-acetyltransferase
MNQAENMDNLAESLLSSVKNHANGDVMRPEYLPEKGELTEIIELLRKLLFPSYFDKAKERENIECHMRGLLMEVSEKLRRQICRALNLNALGCGNCGDMFDKAGEKCSNFLNKLPKVRELLLTDVQATYDGDPAAQNEHEIIVAYPGIFAISVYRLAHELHLLDVPFIPRMMTEYAHSLTGIDIHPGACINHHFFIDHGTGVVIGETTEIGAHVKLYQGVTLGALSTRGGQNLRGKKRHPTIEDCVTVYSGASILGGDTIIGKCSVIGGNVFLTKSVKPDTMVNLKDPKLSFKEITSSSN